MSARNGHKPWTAEQARRGRTLAARANESYWEMGDLVLEIAPMGERGIVTGAKGVVREFAAVIGVSYQALYGYRTVAAAYPPDVRVASLSWPVHREVMSLPRERRLPTLRRFARKPPPGRSHWTVDEARLAIGKRRQKERNRSRGTVAQELRFALGRVQRAIERVDGDTAHLLPPLRELEADLVDLLREASATTRELVAA